MMQPGPPYGVSTRANDADRADVCAIVDNAYADGELDPDEHRQRCAAAMSAKTRSQLLDLIHDLQARPPAFTQQPATAVAVTSSRKWIVGAVVGAGLAVVAILGILGFFLLSPSGSSPSPAPPAQAGSLGSGSTGTFLPLADVVATVSGDFQDQIGHAPEHVSCPGDLAGRVGEFERCSIIDNGKRYDADVTVTAVNGNRITTHEAINEEVPSPPPSRP